MIFVNGTNEPFIVIFIEERFTPLPPPVILTAIAVIVLVVYELLAGNSPLAEGCVLSIAPEITRANGCGPCGIFVPFTFMVYSPTDGDKTSTCSTLFISSPPFPR